MAYSFINKCTKNCFKRTVLVQIIVKDIVTCFFSGHSVETRFTQHDNITQCYYNYDCLLNYCELVNYKL